MLSTDIPPESWFFRDPEMFVAATEFVRVRSTPARILSLPCANGEEPYTMAMALLDVGLSGGMCANGFLIDGIDLSDAAIARARAGYYRRNAFRSKDLTFRQRYFKHLHDELYELRETVRSCVNLHQGDLSSFEPVPSSLRYDVIFCRNLLIYFDDAAQQAAIERLSSWLAPDGILFAAYAELPLFCRQGFVPASSVRGAALKKKTVEEPSEVVPYVLRPPRVKQPVASPQFLPSRSEERMRPTVRLATAKATQNDLLGEARSLADHGDFQMAAAKCLSFLQNVPDSAEAYFMLGLLSERKREIAVAEDYLRRSLYLEPEHYEALCHLALLREQEGDFAQAATLRRRAARVYERSIAS